MSKSLREDIMSLLVEKGFLSNEVPSSIKSDKELLTCLRSLFNRLDPENKLPDTLIILDCEGTSVEVSFLGLEEEELGEGYVYVVDDEVTFLIGDSYETLH